MLIRQGLRGGGSGPQRLTRALVDGALGRDCIGAYFFVLSRQGLSGGSGPQRLTSALGIETGNPIMTLEQRSSFLPSTERATHNTPTGIPYGRCSLASTLSLALPAPAEPALPSVVAYFLYLLDKSLGGVPGLNCDINPGLERLG